VKLIDVQTLSSLLSVKPKTIYDWIHKGYIPHIKLGQLVRFDENEIKEWLERKRRKRPKNMSL